MEFWPADSRICDQNVDEAVSLLNGVNDTSEVVLDGNISLKGNYFAVLLDVMSARNPSYEIMIDLQLLWQPSLGPRAFFQ